MSFIKTITISKFMEMTTSEINDFLGIVLWSAQIEYSIPSMDRWATEDEFYDYLFKLYKGTEHEAEILAELLGK